MASPGSRPPGKPIENVVAVREPAMMNGCAETLACYFWR